MPFLEELVVALGQRPGTDQRHVAAEDVHELRQLVDRPPPQKATDRGHARIAADLEDRPALLVARLELGLAAVGVGVHRPELQALERPAADAGAHRAVDHGPE